MSCYSFIIIIKPGERKKDKIFLIVFYRYSSIFSLRNWRSVTEDFLEFNVIFAYIYIYICEKKNSMSRQQKRWCCQNKGWLNHKVETVRESCNIARGMGIAKFSILMNSRYALLSTTIVTEEAGIDRRREEHRSGRDRIITLEIILLSSAARGPRSLILREGIRLNFISSISIGIISRVGSSAHNNRPNNGGALFSRRLFLRASRRRQGM